MIPEFLDTAIRDLSGYNGEIRPEDDLRNLGLDSLDVVSLAVDMEERPEHPGKITDDEIETWTTVADVIRTLAKGAVQ